MMRQKTFTLFILFELLLIGGKSNFSLTVSRINPKLAKTVENRMSVENANMIMVSGLISKERKVEILKYAKFCCRELGVRPKTQILITVSLYGRDNGEINQLAQNKYQIWLNKALSGRELWETLGHEIQHTAQFESGKLEIKNRLIYFEEICMNSIPYLRREYEVEARKVGKYLLTKWREIEKVKA